MNNEEEKVLVEPSEVWSVLNFANNLYGTKDGLFTPFTLMQDLKLLNNTQQGAPTLEKIKEALNNTINSKEAIISFTQSLENTDMIFRKTMEYFSNLLSYDLIITTKNANKSEYRTKAYKEDLKIVYDFLDRFDYKAEFRMMTSQVLRSEEYFVCLRDESDGGYTLQTLPQSSCMITGIVDNHIPLFDFNFNYFLRGTTDINQYVDSFKERFYDVMERNSIEYNPTAQLTDRDGTFAMWSQLSPITDKAWVFKMDLSNFATNPYLAPMMQDVILNNQIRELQRDKDIASAVALLFGEMPLLDQQKSGQVKDAFAISPMVMGQMLNLVQSGLNKNIKVNALPAKELAWHQYKDENPDMYNKQTLTSAGVGASASSIIYSTTKMNEFEMRQAILNDYEVVRKLYEQYKRFLEFYINMRTKKYKFSFDFVGSNRDFERKERLDNLIKLSDRGFRLNESTWASAIGMTPQAFSRAMEEGTYGDMEEKLGRLISIHTQGTTNEEVKRKIVKRGKD